MSLFVQCPGCFSIYKLLPEHLSAKGVARCGECGVYFQATECVQNEIPQLNEVHLDADMTSELPVVEIEKERSAQTRLDFKATEAVIDPEPTEQILDESPEEISIKFKRIEEPELDLVLPEKRKPDRKANGLMMFFIPILVLLLMFQLIYQFRDDLNEWPVLQTGLAKMCEITGCEMAVKRDVFMIRPVDRSVQAHPSVEGAMLISLTIVNEAAFSQPYPVVEIKLSDLDEQVVAMRRFKPEEYLQDARFAEKGMSPGVLVPVVFETLDPGKNVVAYEFDFL